MSGISSGYPILVIAPTVTVSPVRIHIGDYLEIVGQNFGSTQGTGIVTVDGVTATIVSWADTSITIIIPEVTITTNDYVEVAVIAGGITATSSDLWILLGGILRFVNPDNWSEILLDLDNGGDGSGQEIWQQQGTMIPLPSTETAFTHPDVVDGESLVSTRLPNKDAILQLLLTGDSKTDLDTVVQNLSLEIYKETGCLEYRPERSSKSIYYTYYRVFEAPAIDDYFTHKERAENYAYNVGIKLSCHPWAETEEEEITVSTNLFANGAFEQDLIGWDTITTGAGTPTVTIDVTRYILGGSRSCQLLTNNSGGTAGVISSDFRPVNSDKTHNVQVFGWKQSGTIKVTATLYCYDEDGNATDPASIVILTDKSPTGAAWEDMVTLNGVPIIYPEDWPDGTKKVKIEVKQTGAVGTVSIDGILLSESEFISDKLLEAALGIVIPMGEVKGHIPALMDMYISNAHNTGPWNLQSTGILENLYGIDYYSSTVAVAVGANGRILFNDGSSWIPKVSGVSVPLYSIHQLNANHFWSVGENGVILFSSDGTTWSAQSYPSSLSPTVTDMALDAWTNPTTLTNWMKTLGGLFPGTLDQKTWPFSHSGSGAGFTVSYTGPWTPRGMNLSILSNTRTPIDLSESYMISWWTSSIWFALRGNIDPYIEVHFYNSGGADLGSPKVVHFGITDTWTQLTTTVGPADYPLNTAQIGLFCRASGLAVGDSEFPISVLFVFLIDDWAITLIDTPDLYGVHAISNTNIVAVGQYGCIIKSNGTTWTRKTSGITTNLNAVHAYNTTPIIIAVGDNGTILTSADGTTWVDHSVIIFGWKPDLYGVYVLDATHVWIVGENGMILFSVDAGATWVLQTSPTNKDLYSIYAVDDTHIFACGKDGTLLSSDGTTWVIEGSGTNVNLNSISAYDATHVLAVGNGGTALIGISTYTALPLTDLVVGESKGYHPDFNPVLDAVGTTLTVNAAGQYRRRSRYRAMSANDVEEWLFNVSKHKGTYLISIGGGINNAVNYDQIVLTLRLKDVAGNAITSTVTLTVPASLDLSDASGYTTVGYFREIAMLISKFAEIDIPSSFISSLTKQANINQSIILTAPAGMGGGDRLNIDCLTLIPTDEAYVILNNWRTGASGAQQSFMILSSTDELILSAITDSIESAMVYNPNYTHGSPQFKAKPLGVNLTLIASYLTGSGATMDYQLSPRLNIVLKYKPRWLLSAV